MIRSLLFVILAAASVVQSEALAQAQEQPFGSRRSLSASDPPAATPSAIVTDVNL
eukprot:CAMPEP_0194113700 /NCGR_PEP_ID=MMETSP0150-20130528/17529_1 /TAXON_ID=122233 /ORGANISM="Chaetoceros debilis, Strain MM31A-1" /LENGTH=54 /DNA_ID=CAMNT_0038803695 /DNA_START=15 /DNA_END=179 /DNA_ORIENTATION=+